MRKAPECAARGGRVELRLGVPVERGTDLDAILVRALEQEAGKRREVVRLVAQHLDHLQKQVFELVVRQTT